MTQEDIVRKYDVCVIGGGLGGGTLAIDLVRRGWSVCILEKGPEESSDRLARETAAKKVFGLPLTRVVDIGGGANVWGGVCSPFDASDFARTSSDDRSGWPLSLAELERWYEVACTTLGLLPTDYFQNGNPLVPDDFPLTDLEKKIFQYRKASAYPLKDALQKIFFSEPCSDIYSGIEVDEFLCAGSGVNKVRCRQKDGAEVTITADIFVLSSGALETPKLLSNVPLFETFGASQKRQVGRYLTDHPMGNLMKVRFKFSVPSYFHRISLGKNLIKVGLRLRPKTVTAQNHLFYLVPSFSDVSDDRSEKVKRIVLAIRKRIPTLREWLYLARNIRSLFELFLYYTGIHKNARCFDCWVISEQNPKFTNSVGLDERGAEERVTWSPVDEDSARIYELYDILKREFSDNIAMLHSAGDVDWSERATSAAHHMGTARMGEDSTTGVVDKHGLVFETENLYVCDASVIPVAGNANPGFTVVALAHRLAAHLDLKLAQSWNVGS